jgi:hypothetical protein
MTRRIEVHALGPVDPEEPMTVTVTLRPRHPGPSDAELEAITAPTRPTSRRSRRSLGGMA